MENKIPLITQLVQCVEPFSTLRAFVGGRINVRMGNSHMYLMIGGLFSLVVGDHKFGERTRDAREAALYSE